MSSAKVYLEHKGRARFGVGSHSHLLRDNNEAPKGNWNRYWPQTCLMPHCIPDSPCVLPYPKLILCMGAS